MPNTPRTKTKTVPMLLASALLVWAFDRLGAPLGMTLVLVVILGAALLAVRHRTQTRPGPQGPTVKTTQRSSAPPPGVTSLPIRGADNDAYRLDAYHLDAQRLINEEDQRLRDEDDWLRAQDQLRAWDDHQRAEDDRRLEEESQRDWSDN